MSLLKEARAARERAEAKDQLKQLLKENLKLEWTRNVEGGVKLAVKFDGEEIDKAYFGKLVEMDNGRDPY